VRAAKLKRHAPEAAPLMRRRSDPHTRHHGPVQRSPIHRPRRALQSQKPRARSSAAARPRPDQRDRHHPSAGRCTHPTGLHARSPSAHEPFRHRTRPQ
jgi:hypothetical protein